jgi:integrase
MIRCAGTATRKIKPKPATLDQLDVLAAEMPDRYRLMVPLAAWCALRFGELVELRRADVDLAENVVTIRRAAVRVDHGWLVGDPKSDAGIRDVAIPPHIVPAVKQHLASHVARGGDSLLFPAKSGGHLQPSTLQRHFYKARTAAKRPDLRWHDLRHSGAVLAAQTGATLAELMARLGHSSPAAAMRDQHGAQGRDQAIAAALSVLATAKPVEVSTDSAP